MATSAELGILISARDQASKTLLAVHQTLAGIGKIGPVAAQAVGGFVETLGKVGLAGVGLHVVAEAAHKAADAFTAPIAAASDMNETLSKSQAVFGESSAQVEEFARTAATALGQSKQGALEAAASFGNLFTSMGLGRPEAAGLSTDIVKLASDLASFNNIKPEEALDKLRSGLVGESEPLRSLGINLNEAAVQAEVMRLGLAKAGDEITDAAKIQARYSLIMQQSSNAQGDFAKTSSGLANSQRIIAAGFKDLQVEIGSRLLPVVAPLVSAFAQQLPKAIDAAKPALDRLGALVAGPVKDGILSLIGAISGTWRPAPGIGQFADIAGRLGLVIADVRDGVISFIGALQGNWQPAPGIGQFAELAGRAGLVAAGVRDTVITLIGALQGTWQPGPGIGQAQEAAGRLGLLLKDVVIPAVQAAIGAVQRFAGDPLGALRSALAAVQAVMEPFAPTAARISAAVGAVGAALSKLVPEPVGSFVTGLTTAATSADSMAAAGGVLARAFQLVADATNAASAAIEAGVLAVASLITAAQATVTAVQSTTTALTENKAAMTVAAGAAGALAAVTGLVAVNYGLALAATIPATAASIARAAASAAETAAIYGLILADNLAAVATGAFTAAQTALNLVMAANPIGIVIVAVAALTAAFVYAYNNSEDFRAAVDALWGSLMAAGAAVDNLVNASLAGLSTWWAQYGQPTLDALWSAVNDALGILTALGLFLTGNFAAGILALVSRSGALGQLLSFVTALIDRLRDLFTWLGKVIGRQSQVDSNVGNASGLTVVPAAAGTTTLATAAPAVGVQNVTINMDARGVDADRLARALPSTLATLTRTRGLSGAL